MLLTKEQALKSKRKFVNVFFPELEGELRLGAVMATTSTRIQEINARRTKGEAVGMNEYAVLVIVESVVNEDGSKMFDEKGAADFHAGLSDETFELLVMSIPGFAKKAPAPGATPPVPSETAPAASSPSV